MLKSSSQQACMFGVYSSLMSWYRTNYQEEIPFYLIQIFGSISGFATLITTAPLDMVKTRMQASDASSKYKNTLDCMYKVYKTEGIKAFYYGTVPRIFRSCHGLTFVFYEFFMHLLKHL